MNAFPATTGVVRNTSKVGYPLDSTAADLQMRAWAFFNQGWFQDCAELCQELHQRKQQTDISLELWYLASASVRRGSSSLSYRVKGLNLEDMSFEIGIGEQSNDGPMFPIAEINPQMLSRLQHRNPVESFHLLFQDGEVSVDEKLHAIEEFRSFLANNLWMLPCTHPTAALHIARWLVDQDIRTDFAKELVCSCVGWRFPYKRIDDLIDLVHLLDHFRAPRFMWANAMYLYGDFAAFDTFAKGILMSYLAKDDDELLGEKRAHAYLGLTFHWKEVDEKEGQFQSFCACRGLPECDELNDLLTSAYGVEPNAHRNRFPGSGNYIPGHYDDWVSDRSMQMQHPWYCLLENKEKNFIRNGETAFAACLTTDYSFACSQWWRCIESVLTRTLIDPLGRLIDQNPEWSESDKRNEKALSNDSLFVIELGDPQRRTRITLTQMLWIIEKCMSDCRKGKDSASCIRRQSVAYFASSSYFRWMTLESSDFINCQLPFDQDDMRSLFTPNLLNERAIASFRNAASHDEPMNFANAAAGRLIAKRILDLMHYPKYADNEKLEKLKAELLAKKQERQI